jgi:hypothetical protein
VTIRSVTDQGLPLADRPLVTFALAAYNQKRYIREAIEGAFAQTYEPLEIFLSDDCSTDGTFETMQMMAASYQGPHRVRLNRTPRNVGTLGHALHIGQQALGKLIVMAAGDDVSLAERTASLVTAWQATGAKALSSSFHRIGHDGRVIEENRSPRSFSNGFEKYFSNPRTKVTVNGASSAIDPFLLSLLPAHDEAILWEDICISFLLNRLGRQLAFVDQPLLLYREHGEAITNIPSKQAPQTDFEVDAAEERSARWRVLMLRYLMLVDERVVHQYGESALQPLNRWRMRRDLNRAEDRCSWSKKSFAQRLASLVSALSSARLLKWKMQRMFGQSPNYQAPSIVRRLVNPWGRAD